MSLEAMVVDLLYWLNIVLCLMPVFNNMDMYRQMVVAVEHESETEDEYVCCKNKHKQRHGKENLPLSCHVAVDAFNIIEFKNTFQ